MKKLFCGVLAALMVLTCSFAAFGALESDNITDYPVIIVPGYSASQFNKTNPDGTVEHVWGLSGDEIIAEVMHRVVQVGAGLGMLTLGKAEYIAETVGQGAVALMGDLAFNPNGTSKQNISLCYTTAEETCSATLDVLYPDGNYRHETEIMGEMEEYLEGGKSRIFNFTCDFRKSSVDCAKRLDEYIEDVLQYTGSEKVNIIAVSHGGQTTATYLTLFGHKQRVDNACMTVPAIGGAALAYDLLRGNFDFDELTLINFIEHGMMWEEDYNWLVQAQQLGFLDDILEGLRPYLLEILGNWLSIWDFVPAPYYEDMKAKLLDKEKNAGIIEKSDYMHYQVMPKVGESLRRCNEQYGMNVSIIAGTDLRSVTGLSESSDGIITTNSSTGATVAPLGYRFADGYQAINGDNSYVSPSMTLDASTAYLPDNTWFVKGLFHGMVYKDAFTTDLLMKLTLTDDITSVYSDPRFPRFHATTNKSSSVFAAFNNSLEGHVSAQDTALTVKNLSEKHQMKILAVSCDGLGLKFNTKKLGKLAPGEAIEIPFTGAVPEVDMTHCTVTVTYLLEGNLTPVNERTLSFTISNGEAPAYDSENPYTPLNSHNINRSLDSFWSRILDGLGLKQLISIIFNIFMNIFSNVLKLG